MNPNTDILHEIRQIHQEAELLYAEAEVEAAIRRLAAEITPRLCEKHPLALTVLNGGIIFAGKLLPQLDFPLEVDAINASRYRGALQGGETAWLLKPSIPVQGRTVLLIDDVLDEGITLATLRDWCLHEGATEVLIAVLVEKDLGHDKPSQADFVGLNAPNRYLYGYGLDYKKQLRNAAGIYACRNL